MLGTLSAKISVAALAAVVVGGLAVGGIAYAKSGSASGTRPTKCENFVDHLSTNLNVSQSTFASAFSKALGQVGLKVPTKMQSNNPAQTTCLEMRRLEARLQHRHFRLQFNGSRLQVINALANAWHTSSGQLLQEMKSGTSLEVIAGQHHYSETQVGQIIASTIKPTLDRLVMQHHMSQTRENAVLQRLDSGKLPPRWWAGNSHHHPPTSS